MRPYETHGFTTYGSQITITDSGHRERKYHQKVITKIL